MAYLDPLADDRQQLRGFQLYIVEQWAVQRRPFVISTYTGDLSHSIWVGVVDEAPLEEHARWKDTPQGRIAVTSLSSFPSSTVLLIPDGDLQAHINDFRLSENLRRMGCSGRAGLSLSPPADSLQKFKDLYKTTRDDAVELVRFCQLALVVFDELELEYADGLLCDVTEQALAKWGEDFGHDGDFSPSTVAALLGLLMGARNRLNEMSYEVPRDCFDIKSLEHGVHHFQKYFKMEKRDGKIDRETLEKLHKASARHVTGRFKSTVAGLGSGGEMVVEMVGSKNIAAVETTDIEKFAANVKGNSAKWLWQGKPRKELETPEEFSLKRVTTDERELRKAVLKSVTGKINDARTGFSWIKDAVRTKRKDSPVSEAEIEPEIPITPEPSRHIQPILLRRRRSYAGTDSEKNDARWPRCASFSAADIPQESLLDGDISPEIAEQFRKFVQQELWTQIDGTRHLQEWVARCVHDAQSFEEQFTGDTQELAESYEEALHEWQELRASASQGFQDEETILQDAVKEVELLGAKLEYELGALRSRVQDIEYGIHNFANQVEAIEKRALTLEPAKARESWLRWTVRFFFGIGERT